MFGLKKKQQTAQVMADYDVPSFSAAVLNLLSKLRNPEVSSDELAVDLEIDPGLHVRVLKMVNSAAFGLSHKVSNIRHAVNLLGRGRLESLVLSVAVRDQLAATDQAAWLDLTPFWAAASLRAAVARSLANVLHPKLESDVFTIGLLQNMAIPILAARHGERYRQLYQSWLEQDDYDLLAAEQQCCGLDHAALGGQIAEHWDFPAPLCAAIRSHHSEESSGLLPLAVQVSSLIKSDFATENIDQLISQAEQRFGMSPTLLEELLETALLDSRELSTILQ